VRIIGKSAAKHERFQTPTTRAELDRFHQFAAEKIGSGESPLDLDEFVVYWCDSQHQEEIRAIIDRGLAPIAAGEFGRPAREVTE
jgi:hypothetical protein